MYFFRKEDLDAALLSRFDLCIRYDLPDQIARTAVFNRYIYFFYYRQLIYLCILLADRYAKHLSKKELEKLSSASAGLSCRAIKEVHGASKLRRAQADALFYVDM